MVAEAESHNARLTAGPIAGTCDMPFEQICQTASSVEAAAKSALAACSTCTDFIQTKLPDMDLVDNLRNETQQRIAALQPKIREATREANEALQIAQSKGKQESHHNSTYEGSEGYEGYESYEGYEGYEGYGGKMKGKGKGKCKAGYERYDGYGGKEKGKGKAKGKAGYEAYDGYEGYGGSETEHMM